MCPSPLTLESLFAADVTRALPPVVYLHEQRPEQLQAEIDAYIVTGDEHEAAGIAGHMARLLDGLSSAIAPGGDASLPAIWISGHFGSGKSSFAKLLFLALGGAILPDGSTLLDALLTRARGAEPRLRVRFANLFALATPLSVVFDIGAVARDDEHIHAAALRQIRRRLGYCDRSDAVAAHELRLQQDGLWPRFVEAAQLALGRPWAEASREELAEELFSLVLHRLFPERHVTPSSWLVAERGQLSRTGTSVEEVVSAIAAMLDARGRPPRPPELLFLVIDEIGQYLRLDPGRSLKLQSFIAALGERLAGRVWLVATGQQRLEHAPEGDPQRSLEARFPAHLRVHIDEAHTGEIVQRRLLAKAPERESALASLFDQHRVSLQLAGLGAEALTRPSFVAFYPLLPAYVELLAVIGSRLAERQRARTGEPLALRGLLQLLSALFREGEMTRRQPGALIALDAFFPLLSPQLGPDALSALRRIEHDLALSSAHPIALRAARAVSLLELASDRWPVTGELVARALLDTLGSPSRLASVTAALDVLRQQGVLSLTERHGYRLVSSAGQIWSREREDIAVTQDAMEACIRACVRGLFASFKPPALQSKPVPLRVLMGDEVSADPRPVLDPRAEVALTVEVRLVRAEAAREAGRWVRASTEAALSDRIIWVSSALDEIDRQTSEACRSRKMLDRYLPRRASLTDERRRLLDEEDARLRSCEAAVTTALSRALHSGAAYLRGHAMDPAALGATMLAASAALLRGSLARLFTQFSPLRVPVEATRALFDPVITAPPRVLLPEGLGVLEDDAGRIVATCAGEIPRRVFALIEQAATSGEPGASIDGSALLAHFAAPPFGHPTEVIVACLLGLLRAGSICVRLDGEVVLTSARDAGVRELFGSDRQLRAARFALPTGADLSARDRVRICRVLQGAFGVEIERDNEAMADAFFAQAPVLTERLDAIAERFSQLPGRPALPAPLRALRTSLDRCRRSRQALPTVLAIASHLDVLQHGIEHLAHIDTALTDERIAAVAQLTQVATVHLVQLRQVSASSEIEADAVMIERQLASASPWLGAEDLLPATSRITQHYQQWRGAQLNQQAIDVEATRQRVLRPEHFASLADEDAHRVLRAFTGALVDTTTDDTEPSLCELTEGFQLRLAHIERDALALLVAGKHVRLG